MSGLNAEAVADYLKSNPGFFEHYADLMAQIFVPHPHGGRAVSLVERQMLTLREKSRAAEHKLAELIAFGEDNDRISEKVHRLAVGLLGAKTALAVAHLLNFHLADDFGVPHVAVRLWEKPAGAEDAPEFSPVGAELRDLADTLHRPYCGATTGLATAALFGDAAEHIRSKALIALRIDGRTIGLIAMGSEESHRFYADMGTLYLERIGELAAAALARVMSPAA